MPKNRDTITKNQQQVSTSQQASRILCLYNQACTNHRPTYQTDYEDRMASLATRMLDGPTAMLLKKLQKFFYSLSFFVQTPPFLFHPLLYGMLMTGIYHQQKSQPMLRLQQRKCSIFMLRQVTSFSEVTKNTSATLINDVHFQECFLLAKE